MDEIWVICRDILGKQQQQNCRNQFCYTVKWSPFNDLINGKTTKKTTKFILERKKKHSFHKQTQASLCTNGKEESNKLRK